MKQKLSDKEKRKLNRGKSFKNYRVFHNLSLVQASEKLGLTKAPKNKNEKHKSPSTLSKIENGLLEPSIDILRKMSEVYDVPLDDLLKTGFAGINCSSDPDAPVEPITLESVYKLVCELHEKVSSIENNVKKYQDYLIKNSNKKSKIDDIPIISKNIYETKSKKTKIKNKTRASVNV